MKRQPNHPWDAACKLELYRAPPNPGATPVLLDRGVNFFILILEELGAVTHWSCDGHGNPDYFYIVFEAPYKLALKIQSAGFFDVQIERHNVWSLRFNWVLRSRTSSYKLTRALRAAANAWIRTFGFSTEVI